MGKPAVQAIEKPAELRDFFGPCAGEHVFATPEAALSFARAQGYARVYGIGGEGIYRALLPLADRLLITEVALDIPDDADAFFPDFDAMTGSNCR